MGEINLSDSRGRDAVVATRAVRSPLRVRWLAPDGRQAVSRRVLRGSLDRDLAALLAAAGGDPEAVSRALVEGDPEVDPETFGHYLAGTARVYADKAGRIVHRVSLREIVRNPDGSEKERRPKVAADQNVAVEVPLKWTGRTVPKDEAVRKFVFSSMMQVAHVNGLTYDFLFGIARELEQANAMMLVGAGPKGNRPLVFQRGGTAWRGFLEGRTDGDRYALLLHLSNLELKAPKD